MLFYYPVQAITAKDITSYLYQTYDAISINMNKYNNDSSNTFLLLSVAASEIFRNILDIEYQPTFGLNNLDFTTIDRINRFNSDKISVIEYNSTEGYVKCNSQISGYCAYTDTIYQLENVNEYTDLTRHSLPCDVFLEKATCKSVFDSIQISLIPHKKYNFTTPFLVHKSKVTFNIATNDLSKMLIGQPAIEIEGLDLEYNKITETLNLDSFLDLITANEYIEITSLILINTMQEVSIYIYPYVQCLTADMPYTYIDREDLYPLNARYTLNTLTNKIQISILNNSVTYPETLEPYEEFELNIPQAMTITDYHFDSPNGILYTITKDFNSNQYLSLFPITIPNYSTNYGQLKSTSEQAVKVSYIRDTINKKYIISIYPSNKEYGIESLDIQVKHSYKNARGLWSDDTEYKVGDLVLYNNLPYICKTSHLSQIALDTDSFVTAIDVIQKDILLDLITYNIETNTFEIPFDILFKLDVESIIEINTSGDRNCTLQILAQYHKLDPLVIKQLNDLFTQYDLNAVEVDNIITLAPIKNENDILLSEKINTYNYNITDTIDYTKNFKVFLTSSDLAIKLDTYPIKSVYKTFYLDWVNSNIITSDTITHIINSIDTSSLTDGEKIITTPFGLNMKDYIISDNYLRVFLDS
jgi:hypothetical protein